MAVLLWCMRCANDAVITGDVPVVCPHCKEVTTWTTSPPYKTTENDRKFLHSIHISQTN